MVIKHRLSYCYVRFTRLLAAVGLVLSVSAGQLAVAQDTLRTQVYFRGGMTAVDPSYKNNRSSIERLSRAVAVYKAGGSVEEPFLSIRAGASPDGSMRRNQELSENRAAFLSGYLSEQLGIPRSRMEVASIGEDWERLAEYFRSSEAEWAGAALEIVEHTPIWVKDETGTIVDSRKNRLKRLEDGAVWDFLLSGPAVRCVFGGVCEG